MSQCYQENIEDIEFLQSLVYDQSVDYPVNQFDLISMQFDESFIQIKDEPVIEKIKVDSSEFELFCIENPRKPEKIRESFNNINWYPEGITLGKAMEKGADAVRKYYNDKNIRKRSKK